ncbi:hypothetical protein Ancab_021988 [Ancistrocladus abbreviatus]
MKLYIARWRHCRLFCSSVSGNRKGLNSSPSQASELGNLLLIASITKTLSESGTYNLNSDTIPLSESLVLQVLQRGSLDASKKMDFFYWCSERPGFKHSSATYSQIIRVLFHSKNRSQLSEDVVRNLVSNMKRDGVIIDPSAFKLVLDAFIQSGQVDSAIEILDQMEELGASLNLQIYNSVLVALVRKNQLSLALSMLYKLLDASTTSGGGMACEALACNELLVALRRAGMKKEFKDVFCNLREKKVVFDTWGYNICIHAFGCWGDLQTSLDLFKEMKDRSLGSSSFNGPDLCTYNSLIQVLCLVGKVKDALTVYEDLRDSGHGPDSFTYRILIQGCSKSYRMEDATKIFNEMQCTGFQADTIVYNSLLNGFLKARKLEEACQLFEKMVQDGVRASSWTYNIMIDGLIKNGRAVAGYTLFCDLKKKGQFVDAVTYSIIILHLSREGQFGAALQLVEEMEARGFLVDLITITALVIGLYKHGRWDSVERLVKHMRDRSLLPYILKWKDKMEASMRSPQIKRDDFSSMFPYKGDFRDLLNLMGSVDLQLDSSTDSDGGKHPNIKIQNSDIDEWSSSPSMDQLADRVKSKNYIFPWFSLSRGKRVQAEGVSSFDIDMVNTYLSIFLSKGKLSLACKLFELFTDMGAHAVSYTYNSIVSSFVKKGYFNVVWGALHDMGEKLYPADIATYNLIIQSLGKMGRADLACSVLDKLMEEGGYLDVVMYNTLINALGKDGRVDEAQKLFQQMNDSGVNPDVVTFNTLIEVHTKVGRLKDARKFLRMMMDAGCLPNHATDTTLDNLRKEIEKLGHQ